MKILFFDKNIAVCVKPVGMDSEHQLPAALSCALSGEFFPVHRLDLNVGGVMVYARNKKTAAELSKAIQDGSFVKEYRALVKGTPPENGDWSDFLFKDKTKNKVFAVKKERKGVKLARLEFARLTQGEASLVHIRLHTGRSHQIRVQFASRGYPLLGDHKYGARDGHTAPLLFSCRICFPYRGQAVTYEAFPEWGKL